MRGYNPYGVKLSALALFFAPLLNEGVLGQMAYFRQDRCLAHEGIEHSQSGSVVELKAKILARFHPALTKYDPSEESGSSRADWVWIAVAGSRAVCAFQSDDYSRGTGQ